MTASCPLIRTLNPLILPVPLYSCALRPVGPRPRPAPIRLPAPGCSRAARSPAAPCWASSLSTPRPVGPQPRPAPIRSPAPGCSRAARSPAAPCWASSLPTPSFFSAPPSDPVDLSCLGVGLVGPGCVVKRALPARRSFQLFRLVC